MTGDWDAYLTVEGAAEYLGITCDETIKLPIAWVVGPDGDVWFSGADVERLKVEGWPDRAIDGDDLVEEESEGDELEEEE